MESKRKINGAHAVEIDERSAKRRRLPTDLTDETTETTAEKGLAFVEHLKKTTDKSGRLVATNFLTLPNKRQLPDYYKIIKMPVALDTIQAKLMRREFPTLSAVESYFKRMIANAKEYNQKGSEIYDDAERIRKALSNYMTKNNPAYKTPGYVAVPAPIPPELEKSDSEADAEGEPEEDEIEATPQAKRGPGRPPKNQQTQRSSATPTTSEQIYDGVGFEGLTFQQAQEKIVSDMIRYKEDPDDEYAAFEVFINLPPRSLKDYYQIIPYPVSLKKLQKRVKGIHGRADATGVSDFKTWATFEEETSYIWKNAWHYNEDGSEISNLAKELETYFYKALQEAKKIVPEPVSTKIKLRTGAQPDRPSPKITLHLSGKASPLGSPAPQQNGVNGAGAVNGTARKFALSGSTSGTPSLDQLERTRSMSGSVASPTPSQSTTVKREDGVSPAPPSVLSNQASSTQESQGTTGMLQTTASGMGQSPYPQTGFAHSFPHTPIYHPPNPSYESKWRQPGKTASDAMIMNLSLATHPGLNIARHFRMDLPPSPTMAQQSITINLPSTHYYLQIKPTIAPSLLERQHKLFVTSGTQRLHAMPTIPGHPVDPRHPLFEARLLPGVNRIEIELIAALPKGSAKPANGQDVELEKITVFANLMRS